MRRSYRKLAWWAVVLLLVADASTCEAQTPIRGKVPKAPEPVTLKHGDAASVVAFSPDSSRVLTGGWLSFCLCDSTTGKELERTDGKRGSDFVRDVCWSPDGTNLLIGAGQSRGSERLFLWNIEEWREVSAFEGLDGLPNRVMFSPDGSRIAAGTDSGVVHVFDVKTARQVSRYKAEVAAPNQFLTNPNQHDDNTNGIAFSADGRHALWAGGYSNYQIRVFEAETGKQIAAFGGMVPARRAPEPAIVAARFNGDGQRILMADTSGAIRVWSGGADVSAPVKIAAGVVRSVAFSNDERLALVGQAEGDVTLWNIADLQTNIKNVRPLARLQSGLADAIRRKKDIQRVALSGDGKIAAAAINDGTVRIWNIGGLLHD